jgi:hypothetical protein
MKVTRRHVLVAGLGLAVSGCATEPLAERPGPIWPDDIDRPIPSGKSLVVPASPAATPPNPAAAAKPPNPAAATTAGPVRAVARSTWARAQPIPSRLNRMGGISLITVHHEGWTPVWFDDTRSTADRLEGIRKSHIDRLQAADIGYHYVIDRAGRVWEGRSVAYQGAHVREHNENNLGVMVLGNFDQQQPSAAQLATLRGTLSALMKQHGVRVNKVYTHQELNKTECPGRVLQAHMNTLRRNGLT